MKEKKSIFKNRAWTTSVFMKQIMAVTGLFLAFFVVMHAYGNLKMFEGKQAYDGYAEHLRTIGEPILPHEGMLWILRVALLLAVLLHVSCAMHLTIKSKKARSSKYVVKKNIANTYAAHTMRIGGTFLVLFIIFHILHFTTLHIELGGSYANTTPYMRMIMSFQEWYVWIIYLLALIFLSLHVWHGVASALQSLGFNRRNMQSIIRAIATLVALALFTAFMAPPTAILLGFIQ
ncbi:succinate dehydrogenase cytochrome b subunit [Actinomyces sp. zg-332]|uniref:succinate dehydrogenase cytochrome b subunit n=1 Tax=Actinomyces sp. zg-332 TaxID=2708340 RepID=UPI0018C22E15|nr:succinate dehydrogenase cytochrome b subunit [Actinomyces sp. zg-332]QPK94376.1 succinate dehydrogenase cytochrome b subunit [Actinomyces sp. zg-332]